MKRFLPVVFAASVALLAGCHTADIPEAALPAEGHGETVGHEASTPGHEVEAPAPSATAAAFPSTTPPSGKESVTALGYWGPRKVNTEPSDHHAGGGHGEAAGHGEAGQGEAGH